MKTSKIEAVIFDLDGVLVDTEYYQWQGWNYAFEYHGLDIRLSKLDYLKYAGKRGDQIESELIDHYKLDLREGSLVNAKEERLIYWFETEKLQPIDQVIESIEFVQKSGYKTAVASGGPSSEVMIKLRHAGLIKYFKTIVTGTDVMKGKPNPDIYLKTAEELRVNPKNVLSFEDTQYGLQSAKSAGLTCIVVPTEYSVKQDFSTADYVAPSLEKAIDWAKSNIGL
jgi:HAD superfamily hydrolase (TIGR01509 family)